jgi:DNA (cytosine-5)-methyltransferase 1
MNKLKLLDLFSGIGGFSYGLEQTQGFETIAFCEKDAFCQKVLKKHWNNIPIYDDIKNLDARKIKADIVTFGIPCQPFSVAGKRKGSSDERWLWTETLRVVAETKCRWCILENVDGIINIEEGQVLQQVLKDLEEKNFESRCFVLPTSGFGAPHQRKRIFVIGYNAANSNGKLSNGCSSSTRNSNTEQQRLDSNKSKDWNKIRSEVERCNEQTSWWQRKVKSKFFRVPDGLSTRMDRFRKDRCRSLGNSICPEIAKEIGLAILKAEND